MAIPMTVGLVHAFLLPHKLPGEMAEASIREHLQGTQQLREAMSQNRSQGNKSSKPSTTGYAAPSSSKGWPVWLGLQGMLQGHHCPSVSFPMGPALKPGSPGMHPT
eukprot:1160041-Pelagomonas_calceolata.AAC.2